jgi:hypothetical protein
MAGGDSDTNGAVAGSLLGCLFGYNNLPDHWVRELKHNGWLVSKADAAAYLILGKGPDPAASYMYEWKTDTDSLIDGGKGDMAKEELDARWKVLLETLHRRTGDTAKFEEMERKRKRAEEGCVIA